MNFITLLIKNGCFRPNRLNNLINNLIKVKTTANIDIKLTTNVILLGITYSEAKPLKKFQVDYVNFIVLIGKLVISKFKYGKIKNVYLLFELETELRKKYLKINY